jgi:pimeloyl-ACP methyl ester carboxylesterase
MKIVLLVPGNKETIDNMPYPRLIKAIEKAGYRVKFIPINWKYTTIHDWVAQLEKEYNKLDPKNTILAGFSFGSMTVFLEATKQPPAELWLFSLSPYFAEDLPKLKDKWKEGIGKKRIKIFSEMSFNELVKSISSKTLLFAGDEEMKRYPDLAYRFKEAHTKIPSSKLIIAKDVGHEVTHPNYIKTIVDNI